MLKVRLMGTKNDIAWFQKILQRHPKVEVLEISEMADERFTAYYDAETPGCAAFLRDAVAAFTGC